MATQTTLVNCWAVLIVLALGSSGPALAQESERGVEFSVFAGSFFGGDSGPTVVAAPIHPETRFEDTFGSGIGLTAQYFRQIRSIYRWQVGLVYQNWPGEFFEGGEFQPGFAYGAAGQFDDLTITGLYGGFTFIRQPGPTLRPFASIDLAIVSFSELNVRVSGVSQPYWESTVKDYLLMRCGLAYQLSSRASVTFHAGFSILGQPDSVDVFASGTAGSSLNFGLGGTYTF